MFNKTPIHLTCKLYNRTFIIIIIIIVIIIIQYGSYLGSQERKSETAAQNHYGFIIIRIHNSKNTCEGVPFSNSKGIQRRRCIFRQKIHEWNNFQWIITY